MTFLLDTDILSELVRPEADRRLVSRILQLAVSQQNTSSVNVGELLYGVELLGQRGRDLLGRIEDVVVSNFTILDFGLAEAREYGRIRAILDHQGTPIGDADTRIAATALVHDLTVVTGNTRHFDRVPGLRVENWFEA